MNKEDPLVSVCMITYNQAPFIAQAIEGVLMQKTNFPIELVISDDCSSDGTGKICEQYYTKFPEKINLFLQKSNLGVINNSIKTLSACKGKYIAICEGDDYWTDTLKLQKQVDFLENHDDYGLVHTGFNVVNEANKIIKTYTQLRPKYFHATDVFNVILKRKYVIASLTVVFRSHFISYLQFELKMMNLKMTDLPLWLEISKHSKVKYLTEITANYRVLSKSASHFDNVVHSLEFKINTLEIFSYFARKYKIKFNEKKVLSKYYSNMMKDCYLYDEKLMAKQYYLKMIDANKFSVLNPRPLLFLLGLKSDFFKAVIAMLKKSKFDFIKKHFV